MIDVPTDRPVCQLTNLPANWETYLPTEDLPVNWQICLVINRLPANWQTYLPTLQTWLPSEIYLPTVHTYLPAEDPPANTTDLPANSTDLPANSTDLPANWQAYLQWRQHSVDDSVRWHDHRPFFHGLGQEEKVSHSQQREKNHCCFNSFPTEEWLGELSSRLRYIAEKNKINLCHKQCQSSP